MDPPNELVAPTHPKYVDRIKKKWDELGPCIETLYKVSQDPILRTIESLLNDAMPQDEHEWDIYNSHHNLFLSSQDALYKIWDSNPRHRHYLIFSDAFHIVKALRVDRILHLSLKSNRFTATLKDKAPTPQPLGDDEIIDKYSPQGRAKIAELKAAGYKFPMHKLTPKQVMNRDAKPKNPEHKSVPTANRLEQKIDELIEARVTKLIEAKIGESAEAVPRGGRVYRARGRGRGRGQSERKSWADMVEED